MIKIMLVGYILLLLSACSGGSSESSDSSGGEVLDNTVNDTYQQGLFVDFFVEGITYATESRKDKTDAEGAFLFNDGESIEFSIGGSIIGKTNTKSIVRPVDLSATAESNIASFLISIDEDNIPSNGIKITNDAHSVLESKSINFEMTETDFHNNVEINTLVQNITNTSPSGKRDLITTAAANEHLNLSSLAIIASNLFKIPLSDINKENIGANYNYNSWKNIDPDKGNICDGYINGHSGLDMQTKDVAGNINTADRTFYSLTSGKVIKATGTFGRIIIYDSDSKKNIGYLHARSILVNEGDDVEIGTPLGIQGNTGLSSDPNIAEHVHIEVRDEGNVGVACGWETTVEPISPIVKSLANKKPPVQKSNPVSISGYVYDNKNSTPIRLAKVMTSLDSAVTFTNDLGFFKLLTLTEGNGNYANTPYTVKVSKNGYSTYEINQVWGDNPAGQTIMLNEEFNGKRTDNAVIISLNKETSIFKSYDSSGTSSETNSMWFSFVPDVTGAYKITRTLKNFTSPDAVPSSAVHISIRNSNEDVNFYSECVNGADTNIQYCTLTLNKGDNYLFDVRSYDDERPYFTLIVTQ